MTTGETKSRKTWRWAVPFAAVGAAVAVRMAIDPWLGATVSSGIFFLAVTVSGLIGGLGPGLLATVFSIVSATFLFIQPRYSFQIQIKDPQDLANMVVFAIIGTVLSIAGGWLHISRRRHEDAAIRFRTIFDKAGVGIVEVDSSGRLVAVNDRFCEILGYDSQELIGKNVHDLTAPEDQFRSDEFNERIRRKEITSFETDKRYIREDGRPVWTHLTASVIRERPNRPVRFIGTVVDINERKRAEMVLERRNEGLALLSEAAGELLVAKEPQRLPDDLFYKLGTFLGADIFLNYSIDETDGRLKLLSSGGLDETACATFATAGIDEALCAAVSAELRKPVYVANIQNVNDPRVMRFKRLGIRAYACSPLTTGDRLLGTLSFASRTKEGFSDTELEFIETISHYVSVTRERLRTEAELQAAAAAKDQFLAVLSHELRTPLTPVLAAVSLMERRKEPGHEIRHALDVIKRNICLEARLIDDLLDLTRIVRGKVALDQKPIDVGEPIERAVQVCKPDIEARKLHFSCQLDCGHCLVSADSSRLQQVFWNLIKNSVKFTPDGGCLGISARLAGGNVLIEVTDSGVGIEAEALPRIFNAFEQANHGVTRQFGGLGLGLAITKRIVELHGGRITAHSEGKGRGSTFRIELPIVAEAGTEKQKEPRAFTPPFPAPSMRILLVEDHGDTAEMMRAVLQSYGHDVVTAGDVSQALTAAGSRKFDLLVSDLGLPDRSGLELMQELRRRGSLLKGIALTGFGREDDVRRSVEVGFAEHLTKPVEVDALLEVVRRVTKAN